MKGFLNSMLTPIVKAVNKKEVREFYSLKDYEKFSKEFPQLVAKMNVKYYKGLATSTPKRKIHVSKNIENKRNKTKH